METVSQLSNTLPSGQAFPPLICMPANPSMDLINQMGDIIFDNLEKHEDYLQVNKTFYNATEEVKKKMTLWKTTEDCPPKKYDILNLHFPLLPPSIHGLDKLTKITSKLKEDWVNLKRNLTALPAAINQALLLLQTDTKDMYWSSIWSMAFWEEAYSGSVLYG